MSQKKFLDRRSQNRRFYITQAIPYVNAKPHIGHALEFVQTDVIARYHRLLGEEVLALCGGDENALKNVQAAEAAGVPVQEFVNRNNQLFYDLTKKLKAQFDVWQKGSDQEHHFPSSQKLWRLCADNRDVYKKSYKGLYCVGCETFYEPEELDAKGECLEHPGKKLEMVEEENYFFRLSKYREKLINLLASGEFEVVPEKRKNEVVAFLQGEVRDLSISRSNERAKNWGVPVPGDPTQRMYVWFDALNIYQSGIGFGWDEELYRRWWPADIQVVGKGIVRFHAVYWPAFLLSAGLELPKKLFVHEYLTVEGQKMSKTLGNVYDPVPILERLGTDPLRYYLLAKVSPFEDGDFSEEKLKTAYNADLANGLGNLAARIAALAQRGGEFTVVSGSTSSPSRAKSRDLQFTDKEFEGLRNFLNEFRFDEAMKLIWSWMAELDRQINEKKPWTLQGQKLEATLQPWVNEVVKIGVALQPLLPETAEKILTQFKGPKITSVAPLFPRL